MTRAGLKPVPTTGERTDQLLVGCGIRAFLAAFAVVVVIVIVAGFVVDLVEDDAEDIGLDALKGVFGLDDGRTGGRAGLDDEDDSIDAGADDGCVGHRHHWRCIDDHGIGVVADGSEQVAEALSAEKLGGIGRDGTAGDDVETRDFRGNQGVLEVSIVADQQGGEALGVVDVKDLVQHGTTKVGVDIDHLLPGIGEGGGEIYGGGGLSFARGSAGDGDGAQGLI